MATKYDDIIKLRGGKAAYNIEDEKQGEWTSFIPNEQFNKVLRTVLKAVRGNDIDSHKSFWLNGTYGTGKSHAVAVLSHLLCDDVDSIRSWVDYEYGDEKFATIRNAIYNLREEKRLLTVKVYGLAAMTHPLDLALVLQKAVVATLKVKKIDISVPTDFESFINHIENNKEIIKSITKAINKGLEFVKNNDEMKIAKSIYKQFPDLSLNDLSTIVKRYKDADSFLDSSYIEEKLLINLENLLIDNNLLKDYVPYNDLIIEVK